MGSGEYGKEDEASCVDIVPIDLESLQDDAATGLFGHSVTTPPPLNEKEQRLIDTFKSDLPDTPYRYVPLDTAVFQKALPEPLPEKIEEITNEILTEIETKGLERSFEKTTLKKYLEKCFLNREIPFFTRLNDQIKIGGL